MGKITLLALFLLLINLLKAQGPVGAALNFDGVDDGIIIGTNPAFEITAGTVEAWIKTPDAGSGYRAIVAKRGAYGMYLYNNELVCFDYTTANTVNTHINVTNNQWHHVAFSFNNNVVNGSCLYVDGNQAMTFTYKILNQANNVTIGTVTEGSSFLQNFAGTIDEARIWNRALSQTEINSYRNSELMGNETGLVACYHFNEGVAGGNNNRVTLLRDVGNALQNGILSNFALGSTFSNWIAPGALVSGEALSFDGVDDGIIINNNASLQLKTGTVEAWIKTPNAGSGYRGLIVKRLAYGMYLIDNQLAVYDFVNNVPITTGINLADNQWHHVLFSFCDTLVDGSSLWVDGNNVKTFTYHVSNQTTAVVIGMGDVNPTQNFAGTMDEARIWNANVRHLIIDRRYCEAAGNEQWLVACYHLNEGAANASNPTISSATDVSANSNNGTLMNFALNGNLSNWTTPGIIARGSSCAGTALNFDGNNDFAYFGSNLVQKIDTHVGTTEFWIKAQTNTNYSTTRTLVDKKYFYLIYLDGNRLCWKTGAEWNYQNVDVESHIYMDDNQWHHIAITYDGLNTGLFKMYLDGNLLSTFTSTLPQPIYNHTCDLYIGGTGDIDRSFKGSMDEFRIWDRVLSQEEIQNVKNCEMTGSEPHLVMCCHLNQGIASGVNDNEKTLFDATGSYVNVRSSLNNFYLAGNTSNWTNESAFANSPGCVLVNNNITGVNYGAALDFDGMNDGIVNNNYGSFQLSQGSVEAWIKTADAGSGMRGIVVKDNAYGVYLNNNQLVCFDFVSHTVVSATSGITINDNQWHHIAFSFNNNVVNGSNLYLDGNLLRTFTYGVGNQISALTIGMGTESTGSTTYLNFKGQMDEVHVWNRVISQNEVLAHMNCELIGNESNLVACYHFNQGYTNIDNHSENILRDDVAYAENGTLYNFALNGASSNWIYPGAVTNSCGTSARMANGNDGSGKNPAALSVSKFKSGEEMRIYPNPTEGTINIEMPADNIETANIRVTDMLGREVFYKKTGEVMRLNAINLKEEGFYLVMVTKGGETLTMKIVVIQ